MQRSSLYIYLLGASIGGISIVYFLSLFLHLPFIAAVLLVVIAEYFLCRWLLQLKTVEEEQPSPLKYGILLYGIASIGYVAPSLAGKHGAWDAWAIWNLHAGYLADTSNWKNMFLNTEAVHPDYPLALPATLAFLNKLFGNTLLVNYSFHILITLCIPAIIYLQTYKRAWLLSAIAFILLCRDEFYITLGVYQMADTPLALFLLLAMIAIDNIESDNRYTVVSAAMLGCCIWTKNEGLVLAILFPLFFYKDFFTKKTYKYTLAGLALPLTAYVIFKIRFAPQNDILQSQGKSTLEFFTDKERYRLIYTAWKNSINLHYYTVACAVTLCVLLAIIRRKFPDRRIAFVLCACIAYCVVYIVTPHDLEWHLKTSVDRLIHQLMPVSIYASLMYITSGSFFNFRARFVTNQ